MLYSTQAFTAVKRQRIWDKSQGRCWYCGLQTIRGDFSIMDHATEQFCIDHANPWNQGGSHDDSNLVPCCRRCNARKGKKGVEAYRLLLAQEGLPIFTHEHIAYLQQLGVALPAGFPCYPVITFWFEREGLQA